MSIKGQLPYFFFESLSEQFTSDITPIKVVLGSLLPVFVITCFIGYYTI